MDGQGIHGFNDFSTLLLYAWYEHFPVDAHFYPTAKRSDWTAHISSAIRRLADITGLFVRFESQDRTDAIVHSNTGNPIAVIEWEWDLLTSGNCNELQKLREHTNAAMAVFIGYAKTDEERATLDLVQESWAGAAIPLLLVLISHDGGLMREFQEIAMFRLDRDDRLRAIRRAPALPWMIPGTRWVTPPSGNKESSADGPA